MCGSEREAWRVENIGGCSRSNRSKASDAVRPGGSRCRWRRDPWQAQLESRRGLVRHDPDSAAMGTGDLAHDIEAKSQVGTSHLRFRTAVLARVLARGANERIE